MFARRLARITAAAASTGALLWVAIAPPDATAQSGARGAQPSDQGASSCPAFQIEYQLAGRLQLTDTPMGQGNGVYDIGPGRVVLRFENVNGGPGGRAEIVAYDMRERFDVHAQALFWKTTAVTDSHTTTSPGACGVAEGALSGNTLAWRTPLNGYKVDGSITCTGSLCGSFGAPPPGTSGLHLPAHDVQFKSFTFTNGMKTFTMPFTFVSKSEHPKQTAYMALAGREVSRQCVQTPVCQ